MPAMTPSLTVAGGWVLLELLEPMSIDTVRLPGRFSQPPIQTAWVGGLGKFPRDAAHCLAFYHKQANPDTR